MREGDYVLVFFEDDDVWHEMMICGRAGNGVVSVFTPDGDQYLLCLRGPVGDLASACAWIPVGRGGELPGGLTHNVYCFDSLPGRVRRTELLRRGLEEVKAHARRFKVRFEEPGGAAGGAAIGPGVGLGGAGAGVGAGAIISGDTAADRGAVHAQRRAARGDSAPDSA